MTHQCHWTEVREHLPAARGDDRPHRAADRAPRRTSRCKMADGQPMEFEPGQILEVSLFGYGEIPIGFASSPTRKHTFDLVVRTRRARVRRPSTGCRPGSRCTCAARWATASTSTSSAGHDVLIVAGGIGLCPTRSLIQYILDRRDEFKRFMLFYGAREPKQQLFHGRPREVAARIAKDVEYHETVDKADPTWKGNVGVITTLFPKVEARRRTRGWSSAARRSCTSSSSASSTRSASRATTSSSTSSGA